MTRYIIPILLLILALFLYYNNNSILMVTIVFVSSAASFAFVNPQIRRTLPKSIPAKIIPYKWFIIFFIFFLVVFFVFINPVSLQWIKTPGTGTPSSTRGTANYTKNTTYPMTWIEVENISGSGKIEAGQIVYELITFSHPFDLNKSYKIEHTRKWDWDVPPNMAGNGDVTWSLINPNNSTCWSVIDYSRLLQWTWSSTSCRYVGDPFTQQIVNTYDAKVLYSYYIVLFEMV